MIPKDIFEHLMTPQELEQNKSLTKTIKTIYKNQVKMLYEKIEQTSQELNSDYYNSYYEAFFFVIYRVCTRLAKIDGVKIHAADCPVIFHLNSKGEKENHCVNSSRVAGTVGRFPFASKDLVCDGINLFDEQTIWIQEFADAIVRDHERYIAYYKNKFGKHDIYIYNFGLLEMMPQTSGVQKHGIVKRDRVVSE